MQAGFQTLLTVAFLLQHQLRLHRAPPPAPTMALFRTALEETAAARLEAGVAEWRTWGPGGGVMLPIGVLPTRTPPPLLLWSLEQWQAWAAAAEELGVVVAEPQPPTLREAGTGLWRHGAPLRPTPRPVLRVLHQRSTPRPPAPGDDPPGASSPTVGGGALHTGRHHARGVMEVLSRGHDGDLRAERLCPLLARK